LQLQVQFNVLHIALNASNDEGVRPRESDARKGRLIRATPARWPTIHGGEGRAPGGRWNRAASPFGAGLLPRRAGARRDRATVAPSLPSLRKPVAFHQPHASGEDGAFRGESMLHYLSKWRIGPRLNIGFAAVLGLLVVTSIVAAAGLSGALTSFHGYRELARLTFLVGRVETNMLGAEVAERNFVLGGNENAAAAAEERMGKMADFVARAQEVIRSPERAAALDAIDADIRKYGAAFAEVKGVQADKVRYDATLATLGDGMAKALHEVMESTKSDGNAEAAYLAGLTLSEVFETRLRVAEFSAGEDTELASPVDAQLAEAAAAAKQLVGMLNDPARFRLTRGVIEDLEAYAAAFAKLTATVERKHVLAEETLHVLGPSVVHALDELELNVKADEDALAAAAGSRTRLSLAVAVVVAVASLILGVAASRLLATSIRGPLAKMTGAMQALAQGDLATEVPCRDLTDEIGEMSEALQVFKDNAVERQRLEDEQRQRSAEVDDAIGRFDREVAVALGSVGTASRQLDGAANTMAAAAGQASSNVQAVATAAEEMSASVSEIGHQTDTSREVANEAVRSVETASKVVHELNGTAQQITGIVDLISDIADQTNLLALNATIEAARAGDAGKGFAVVAHEVKTLAGRTGQATADIAEKIDTIRSGSDQAVRMIAEVTTVMGRLDEVATAIAGAIEEQSATTTSIAQNAQEAAQGTENVVETIRGGGGGGSHGTQQSMVAASKQLAEQTELLRGRVQSFFEEIRAA
jgi:methyl-accepting chemotaxis protein